jgi:hypothetical protein
MPVTVNMTSIPSRFCHLQSIVDNLRTHASIDSIVIHIPKKYDNPKLVYDTPPSIKGATVNIVDKDYGPARRYIYAQGGPDTTVLVVDDDTWYDPRLSETLLKKHSEDKGFWTGSGFNFEKYFIGDFSKVSDESVTVMEGYGMILLPGTVIDTIRDEFKVFSETYTTCDDLILANLLEKYYPDVPRHYYTEPGWINQLEYGFLPDALHNQNAEGTHVENYKRVLKSLKQNRMMYFTKPVVSYAIGVCNEYTELETLLEILVESMIHSDEICILVDEANTNDHVTHVLTKYAWAISIVKKKAFSGDFSEHKNFLGSLCSGKYIFNIDADEVPTELLMDQVYNLVRTDSDLIMIPRVNIVLGRTTMFTRNDAGFINWPDYQGRMYKNNPQKIQWSGKIHETIQGAERCIRIKDMPNISLWHIKKTSKLDIQKQLYDSLTVSDTNNMS